MKKKKGSNKPIPLTDDEKRVLNMKLVNDAVFVQKAWCSERELAYLNRK